MTSQKTSITTWLIVAIVVYITLFSFFSFWKYNNFAYNALDLAIFNQVFFNSAQGNLFQFTIHPHSFLGDHLAFALIFFLPIYWLWQSPLCLLLLQTIAIGLAAWPLFKIAQHWLRPRWAFLVSLLFLLSPFTQLLVIGLGFLALFDKRKTKWWLTPWLAGIAWMGLGYYLTTYFSQYDSYKFLAYFSWLGDSPWLILQNFFLHPLVSLSHIFSGQNLLFTIGLLIPFLFIPLLKPKYLLISCLHFLLFILAGSGKIVILKSHYLVFLTSGLWISFIPGLKKLSSFKKPEIIKIINEEKAVLAIILLVVTVYSAIALGPLGGMVKQIFSQDNKEKVELQTELNQQIPAKASLLGSYSTLTNLSSRAQLYENRYLFLGTQQYSLEEFPSPENIDYALLNTRDLLVYGLQYDDHPNYQEGADRLREYFTQQQLFVVDYRDDFVLLGPGGKQTANPWQILDLSEEITPTINQQMAEGIKLVDLKTERPEANLLPVTLFWKTEKKVEQDYQLLIDYLDRNRNILNQKVYATGYGLLPTSDWPQDNTIKTAYRFLLPEASKNRAVYVRFSLVKLAGYFGPSDIYAAEIKKLSTAKQGESLLVNLSTGKPEIWN